MYVRTSKYRLTPEGLKSMDSSFRSIFMEPIAAVPGNRLFAVLQSPDDELDGLFVSAWDSMEACDVFLNEVRTKIYAKWQHIFDGPLDVHYWETKWPGNVQVSDESLQSDAPMYVRISRFKFKPGAVEKVAATYKSNVLEPLIAAPGNRFVCVLLSTEENGVGSQVTGWSSKEDWERFYAGTYQEAIKGHWDLFEVKPTATFWSLTYPGRIRL